MSVSTLLVNTCTLSQQANGQSATTGGMTTILGTGSTDVPCAIQTMSGYESVQYFRETGKRGYNCYFAAGTTITTAFLISSITGSSIDGLSGVTLTVTSPPQDHAGRGSYVMVTAEEVQQ